MSEEWKADELGFITNGSNFFRADDIRCVRKKDEDSIDIYLYYYGLVLKFSVPQERDRIYDWFVTIMTENRRQFIKERREATKIEEEL